MYPKSLWEKIGDMLAHPGKRFLLGMLSIPLLWPFGVLIAISILESRKDYFEGNVYVRMPGGEVIPCALVKRKHYAYIPLIPFVCPFFYVPYKSEYILIKSACARNVRKGQRVYNTVVDSGVLRMETVTKAKATAMQLHPEIIAGELSGQVEKAREDFLAKAGPFFAGGVMEEVSVARHFTACKVADAHFVFYYGERGGEYRGIGISEEGMQTLKKDPSLLLTYMLTEDAGNISVLRLSDANLERLLRDKQQGKPREQQAESNARAVLDQVEQRKKVLTRQQLEKFLNARTVAGKKWGGWGLALLTLGAAELGVAGLIIGVSEPDATLAIMGVIFLAAGIWLTALTVKSFKKGSRNKGYIQSGQYRILRAVCTGVKREVHETDEGMEVRYHITYSNGEKETQVTPRGKEGDAFYLVYIPDVKEAQLIISGMEYTPAPELRIEDAAGRKAEM